jgi:cytochrome c-type biogenesis protein CcmH
VTVYRGQLAEVDRDLERGLIGATDAATLRTEISRRILDLDRAGPAATAGAKPAGLVLPAIALVAAIALAYGLYDRLGAPGYADLPHAERIANSEKLRAARPTQAQAEADAAAKAPKPPAPDPQFADLMAKLRAAVAARPTDEVGLRLLARNERTLGNIAAAAKAQGQLVALLGDKAGVDDWAALSDDLVFAAGGLVTADAEKALAETLRRDPRQRHRPLLHRPDGGSDRPPRPRLHHLERAFEGQPATSAVGPLYRGPDGDARRRRRHPTGHRPTPRAQVLPMLPLPPTCRQATAPR